MSISKKRALKSLNHSTLSQFSNSQNLRDSSIFKNQILSEIKNAQINCDPKIIKKQQQQTSTSKKKKKSQFNKFEFKQINLQGNKQKQKGNILEKQNKISNYLGLTKTVEQKNNRIINQEKQIQILKGTLDKVRRQLSMTRVDFEKKKLQDLASLKRQQKQNQENIKQLQVLRVGIRQLKAKIQSVEQDRLNLQRKNHEYLQQNEQLTIKLTTLKQQYLTRIHDEKIVTELQHQITYLKQQVKLSKQIQIQKSALEQRCYNFQRKINEYIIKYNEVQTEYNQAQIKYYRAQKQNDDLKMNIEELQMDNKNIRKMLEEQKKILIEQTQRWKTRITKLEDNQKYDKSINMNSQTKTKLSQLQDRYINFQQSSRYQQKIQQKNIQIKHLTQKIAQQYTQIQGLKNQRNKQLQNYKNKQDILENTANALQSLKYTASMEIKQMKVQIEQLTNKKQQLQIKISDIMKCHSQQRLKSWEQISKQKNGNVQTIKNLQQKLNENHTFIQQKINELWMLNQRIKILQLKLQKSSETINSQSNQLQQYEIKLQQLVNQLNNKNQNISILQKQLQIARNELNEIKVQRNSIQQTNTQKHYQILSKIQILQSNIKLMHNRQLQLNQQIKIKQQQIIRLQNILNNTNIQLRDIKLSVQQYKHKIQNYNENIIQMQRKYNNQIYMTKQAQLKYEEQIKYYKSKYQDSFKQNINLSDKICEFQRQFTQQNNKHTQILRVNSYLQMIIQRANDQQGQIEQKHNKDINDKQSEIKQLNSKICQYQVTLQNNQNRIKQLQNMKCELQNKLGVSNQQYKRLGQWNEKLIIDIKNKHTQQLSQLSFKITQNSKQTLQFEQFRFQKQYKLQSQQILALNRKIQYINQQLLQKDKIIHQNYQLILSKNKQIQNINIFKINTQNEQIQRIKQYNIKLSQQVQQLSLQLNKNIQQLRQANEQCQRYKSNLSLFEKDLLTSQNRNIQLMNQININKSQLYNHCQENQRIVSELRCQINSYQEKIVIYAEQINMWTQKYENADKQYKKVQHQCQKASRAHLQESNKKNKENNRQIDNYRAHIRILQQQNANLQRIMDRELAKRKTIIQDLIREKKLLYEQIGR